MEPISQRSNKEEEDPPGEDALLPPELPASSLASNSILRVLQPQNAREMVEGMRAIQCQPMAWLFRQEAAARANGTGSTAIIRPPLLKRVRLHRRHVLGAGLARKRLITCSADGVCRVCRKSGAFEQTVAYEEHGDTVLGCFIVDDHRVVTWSRDCSVKLWDYNTGTTLRTFSHARPVKSACVASGMLFTFSLPQTLTIFDLEANGAPLRQITDFVRIASPLVVSLPYVVCGTFGAQLKVFELRNRPLLPWFNLVGHSRAILAVAIGEDPESKLVLTGSEDRTAILFDLHAQAAKWVLKGHTEAILSCAMSSKQQQGMTGSVDKTSRIWSLVTGECLMILGCSDSVTACAFDSTLALCGCADNSALLFDISRGGVDAIIALLHGSTITEGNKESVVRGVPLEILQNIKSFLL